MALAAAGCRQAARAPGDRGSNRTTDSRCACARLRAAGCRGGGHSGQWRASGHRGGAGGARRNGAGASRRRRPNCAGAALFAQVSARLLLLLARPRRRHCTPTHRQQHGTPPPKPFSFTRGNASLFLFGPRRSSSASNARAARAGSARVHAATTGQQAGLNHLGAAHRRQQWQGGSARAGAARHGAAAVPGALVPATARSRCTAPQQRRQQQQAR